MTFFKLVFRSLCYYWRTHLQVLLGVLIASAVLIGALAVGDSVRYSLRRQALHRLGKVDFALGAGDRFFRWELADDLARDLSSLGPGERPQTHLVVAPVLQVRGVGVAGGGAARAQPVQVLGIDQRFGRLSLEPAGFPDIRPDEAVINRRLAEQLQLKTGDEFLLRVEKGGMMPADTPLASDQNTALALRVTVKAIATDADLGVFSLRADQVPPFNAFLSGDWLARKLDLAGKANLMLLSGIHLDQGQRLAEILPQSWQLEDAQLELRYLNRLQTLELRSPRVFLDLAVVEAIQGQSPPAAADVPAVGQGRPAKTGVTDRPLREHLAPLPPSVGVLSYFVNEIRCGPHRTPYSVVSAPGAPLVPDNLARDQIILNEWLAADLAAEPGSSIEMTYYVMGPLRQLRETSAVFRVHSVIPLRGAALDPDLMPPFPGLADAASCRDWDPGVPVELSRIRKKDEDYWDQHRGTPKAFVTLAAAQQMWSNRFGNLTALRFPLAAPPETTNGALTPANVEAARRQLETEILARLNPSSLGLQFLAVREANLRASKASVDFGQLFLGLSFFLIVAALLLTAMLFAFGAEVRAAETGTLRALGFRVREVRRLFLGEALWVVGPGVVMGCLAGVGYTWLVLVALGSVWQGAVGGVPLFFKLEFSTMVVGIGASLLVVFLAIVMVIRRQSHQTIQELRSAWGDGSQFKRRSWICLSLALACGAGAAGVVWTADAGRGGEAAGVFFGAGSLLLMGLLLGVYSGLLFLARQRSTRQIQGLTLAIRSCSRRSGRSLVVAAALACGVFLVMAVAANRHDPARAANRRDSGTGGFAFYGETSLPILHDLNTPRGRKFYALDDARLAGVQFVMARLREGDDASCLNLNRAQEPALLGVDPNALAGRGAFQFAALAPGVDRSNPWSALTMELGDNIVPAVADQTVITWGLNKAIGDTLTYRDERGKEFKIRFVGGLANSVLQGKILVAEEDFIQRFPSLSGARVLLVDAPTKQAASIASAVSLALQDEGLVLTETARRLAEFSRVENTYLSIFLVLGGLGMVLGSVGMGIVVMRNVLERRGELALLRAVGFSRRFLSGLVFGEHLFLQIIGIGCGLIAALIAVWPAIRTPGTEIPWLTMTLMLGGIFLNGTAWVFLATLAATRGELLFALREE
jgi:putative ABC transport system permease protein